MAESAVRLLIEYLGLLLVEEVKLLKGVCGEVRRIKDDLESMQAFLRDADAREDNNESIKAWVRQVRHASHDIEDMLDEFIFSTKRYEQDRWGVFGALRKMAHSIKQLRARQRIVKQIQDMRGRLSDISKRKDDYNLNREEQVSSLSNSKEEVYDPQVAALFTEEYHLIGIDGPRAQLIGWLLKGEKRLSTMSVVGMGGLGKTTLVKKVYDDIQVKKHFETYAWITVSQTFKKQDLLQDMISQFHLAKQEDVASGVDAMTDIQLIQLLRDHLENKRFVLVFDDVWGVDAWKFLMLALPAREHGSRVILTMRRHDIASACCIGPSDYIYEHQPLNPNTAWCLFCRRAFPTNHEGNHCPPELYKLAQSFVKKCQGLPLAIVTLGGLLASKGQTYAVWEKIHHNLGSELESDNLGSMMKILWLSFNDLPFYLKSCYLYLSIFPEDNFIGNQQIIDLWAVEGLIIRKEGRTLTEVGESYLDALITRSLIEVAEGKCYESFFMIRIHDLLREIIILKSREENLFVSSGTNDDMTLSDRTRHLTIYSKGEVVPKFDNRSRLRSLHIFRAYGLSTVSPIISFAGFHLLRVVNIEDGSMESFPKEVTNLLLLRFLCLSGTKIKHLPSSIGNLINLETLILENNFISELPVEICRLLRLQTVSVRNTSLQIPHEAFGSKVPGGVAGLKFLRVLRSVQVDGGAVGELGKLTQLKVLGINRLRREDGPHLCTSIQKMSRLQSLEVISLQEDEEIDLHSLSNTPQTLQELYLLGCLKKLPHWISSLQNLLILYLRWSRLRDDPLKSLSSLRNLVELRIVDAYHGEELYVKEGDYPNLRDLWISDLRGLKKVKVEEGAMPNLEILSIGRCQVLVDVPFWIGHLTNLKQLSMIDMPMDFLKSLQRNEGEEQVGFIQHIPVVSYYDSQTRKNSKF